MGTRYTVIEGRGETDDTYRYLSVEPPLSEEVLTAYSNELGCTAIFTVVSTTAYATELEFHFQDTDEADRGMRWARNDIQTVISQRQEAEFDFLQPQIPVSGSAPLSEQYRWYIASLLEEETVQVQNHMAY